MATASTPMKRATLIVAHDSKRGIGSNGKLPWRLSQEMRYFANATTAAPEGHQNAVIMGRTTWEGIPPKFRPLKNRLNVVLSSKSREDLWVPMLAWRNSSGKLIDAYFVHSGVPDGVVRASSLSEAMQHLHSSSATTKQLHHIFIIGGAQLYNAALSGIDAQYANRILLTRITRGDDEWTCDTFFPDLDTAKWEQATHAEHKDWLAGVDVPSDTVTEGDVGWQYEMWVKKV